MKKSVDSETILLDILKEMQPQASTNVLRKMLTNQRITVDGQTIHRAKHIVNEGQTVEIHPKAKFSVEEERRPPPPPPPQAVKNTSKKSFIRLIFFCCIIFKSSLMKQATKQDYISDQVYVNFDIMLH